MSNSRRSWLLMAAVMIGYLPINNESSAANINKNISAENNVCNQTTKDIQYKIYTYLYKYNNPSKAGKILNEQEECADNNYKKAVITDLRGDVLSYGYKLTHKEELADKAEHLYKLALKLNTNHDEIIYWHLSLLMREKRDVESAIKYINKVLVMKVKEPYPYLTTAFLLSVDAGHWDDAKQWMDIIYNRKSDYYYSIPFLLASVRTLNAFNKCEPAKVIVRDVEKNTSNIKGSNKLMFDKAKAIAARCKEG